MMIYEGHDAQTRLWRIEVIGRHRQPIVRWRCWDSRGCQCLWKSSTWTGDGWSCSRWVPNNAQVPAYLRRLVELRLVQQQQEAR